MHEILKRSADVVATIVILPSVASFYMRALVLGKDRALEGSTQALAWIPGLPGRYLRRAFLRRVLAYCHPTATIEFGAVFSQVAARLEADVYVGPGCHLGWVHLERDVLVGAGVHIPSGGATHDFSDITVPIRLQPHHRSVVRVGQGSWIGSAAIVMADVGSHTVVGAGSVVTKPLPDYVVAAGTPARVLKSRLPTVARA